MSSFNPYTKATKEAVNVDFTTRQSPQKVILCNRQNKFYGEFIGKVTATEGMVISSGVFTGVDLSNVTIYDSEGREIDLRDLSKTMRDVSAYLQVELPWISAFAADNRSLIGQLSGTVDDLFGELGELSSHHGELVGEFNQTFVPTLESVDPDKHEAPDFLVLKDQSDNGDLYALEMVDGMLAAKKIGFTE